MSRSVLNPDTVPQVSLTGEMVEWWCVEVLSAYLGNVESSAHELECAHRKENKDDEYSSSLGNSFIEHRGNS